MHANTENLVASLMALPILVGTGVDYGVMPLEGLGVMDLVSGEKPVTDELTLLPTPGHTPDLGGATPPAGRPSCSYRSPSFPGRRRSGGRSGSKGGRVDRTGSRPRRGDLRVP